MKKIQVNENACVGCGACVGIDSEHFDFNAKGFSNVISNDNLESDALKSAIASCPTEAISIVDDNCKEECHCENCEGCSEC